MGYDAEDFVDEPCSELLCVICMKVLEDPKCCQDGHTFCRVCIRTWLKDNHTCPVSRSLLKVSGLTTVRPIASIVDNLKVRCRNRATETSAVATRSSKRLRTAAARKSGQLQGEVTCCNWIGTLSERKAHQEKNCKYHDVQCGTCADMVNRSQLVRHKRKCRRAWKKCQYCDTIVYSTKLVDHWKTKCPEVAISCPKKCGEDTILRKNLSQHQLKCEMEKVKCPFHEFGCKTQILRGEIDDHQIQAAEYHKRLCRAMANGKHRRDGRSNRHSGASPNNRPIYHFSPLGLRFRSPLRNISSSSSSPSSSSSSSSSSLSMDSSISVSSAPSNSAESENEENDSSDVSTHVTFMLSSSSEIEESSDDDDDENNNYYLHGSSNDGDGSDDGSNDNDSSSDTQNDSSITSASSVASHDVSSDHSDVSTQVSDGLSSSDDDGDDDNSSDDP